MGLPRMLEPEAVAMRVFGSAPKRRAQVMQRLRRAGVPITKIGNRCWVREDFLDEFERKATTTLPPVSKAKHEAFAAELRDA